MTQGRVLHGTLPRMNRLTRTLLASVLSLGTPALTLHAQAPAAGDPFVKDATKDGASPNADKNAPWHNCLAVLEVYAIDKKDAFAVLESEGGGGARYRKVMDLAKAGKARFEILTAVTAVSGQRVVAEAIDEVRYPTEFHPPELKNSIAAPTAWETRNVGDSFEFEVLLVAQAEGRFPGCTFTLVPQRVGLKEFQDIGGMANDDVISQPQFVTQKITTSALVHENEPFYLGTMTPTTGRGIANGQANSEVWFAFLHAYVPGPKPEEIKPPAKPAPASSLSLEYSFYSMDRAQARDLLLGSTTLNAPWEKLEGLLNAKKATMEHVSTVNTVSGQRSVTEEIQETRFASEYSAESIRPSRSESTTRTVEAVPAGAKDNNGAATTKGATTTETVSTTHTDANGERQPGGATAFETRNAGVTIEAEPVIGPDGVSIDLSQSIQSVTNLGNLQVTGIAKRYPPTLLFETRRVTNSQTLLLGRHQLIGTFNPPGTDGVNERQDSGRTWLVFVRATNEP